VSPLKRFILPSLAAVVAGPVAAVLVIGLGSANAAAPHTSSGRVQIGSAPMAPVHAQTLGSLAAGTKLSIVVGLEPRDAKALSTFATAVATPGTPQYHQYLTVPQFRARFGATARSVAAVRSALVKDGLSLGATRANGLSFDATGTAGTLERAFSTTLDRLALPGGRVAYSNVTAPTLPAAIGSDVESIVGLSNVFLPHRAGLVVAKTRPQVRSVKQVLPTPAVTAPTDGAITSCAGATGEEETSTTAPTPPLSGDEYTAQDLAQAYDYDPLYAAGDEGQGVTVGIYELEPNFATDIPTFETCYGINTTVNYVPTDGGPTGTASAANMDGEETELDIENIIELAPKVTAEVYQAPNTDAGYIDQYSLMIAPPSTSTTPKLNVISSSWGECEAEDDTATMENTLFSEAAAEGITVTAASGDSGAQDCELALRTVALPVSNPAKVAVDDPAAQPFVTGAGGTSLDVLGDAPTTKPTEVVWNNGHALGLLMQGGGGGGGISSLWTMPSYQTGAAAALNVTNSESSGTPCAATTGDCREVPDVSADADPYTAYTIYYDGKWTSVGGTSGAAPLWTSVFAEADGSPGCEATGDIGFANPALYGVASSSTANYGADFNDITSGNNDVYGTNKGAFAAGTGYDEASGLGTPVTANLAPALCSEAAGTTGGTTSTPGSTTTPSTTTPSTTTPSTTTPSTTTPSTTTPSTTTTETTSTAGTTTTVVQSSTVTTPDKTVTVSQSSTTNTVKKSCKIPTKLSFVQHPAYPVREIKAVLYINGKLTKTVKGKRIVDVVINRPKATKFTLRLVTTLSSAEVVSHQLTYNGCISSKVTVKVLHKPVGGVRR
jgi:subtilase family serine protease